MKDQNDIYNNIVFIRKNNLIREIVMVDAIGRSGKGMLAHVLSSFEWVEKQHNLDIFEWIGILWRSGKITKDAAVTLLRFEGDTRLYNAFISRDVNFRLTDDTGVFKNADPTKYFRRLFTDGGAEAVERCLAERAIMQTCIHDGIRNAELFFDAFGEKLKIIYITRDPVYLIYEWNKSDFGRRIGNDLREFQLTVRWGDGVVPYTAIGWEEEYLSLIPHDRVIALINYHFNLNMDCYVKLDKRMRAMVLMVNFEELVTDPMLTCNRIAGFLGTKTTPYTEEILRKERCPRIQNPEDRKEKIADIVKNASQKYVEIFHKLLERYESRFWELA